MYHPVQGRFLSLDPMREDGIDLMYQSPFAYAANSPNNRIDPSGLFPPTSRVCFLFPDTPAVRSVKECCDAARADKSPVFEILRKKSAAAVVCCDGRPVGCIWRPAKFPQTPLLEPILDGCKEIHEDYHLRYHGVTPCPKEVPSLGTRRGFATDEAQRVGECVANAIEIDCLIKGLQTIKERRTNAADRESHLRGLCTVIDGSILSMIGERGCGIEFINTLLAQSSRRALQFAITECRRFDALV
jgi:hypothetical protein